MKIKNLFLLILTGMTVMACTAVTQAQEEKSKYPIMTISPDKKLTKTEQGVEVTEGNCTLFELKTSSGGDPRVDARVVTTLTFEVPKGTDSFELKDEDFDKNKAYVVISECRCMNRGYNPIHSGYIKGTKKEDGNWQIDANVTAKGKDNNEDMPFEFQGVIPAN